MLQAVLVLFILSGVRPGELLALKWKDIDLANATISIRLAASCDLTFDDDWKVKSRKQIISNTKTALSVRSFVLSESAVESLRKWKMYLSEQQLKTGIDYTSGDCFVRVLTYRYIYGIMT
jgi:integrase